MKECGECTACCYFTNGAGSKPYSTCKHCDQGCSIYEDRPQECVNFECVWLQSESPDELRPDRCGVMFEMVTTKIYFAMFKHPDDLKGINDYIEQLNADGISVIAKHNSIKVSAAPQHDANKVYQIAMGLANGCA